MCSIAGAAGATHQPATNRKPIPPLKAPEKTPTTKDTPPPKSIPVPPGVSVQPTNPEAIKGPENARTAVPFPHPLITEVLYSVPTGVDGDANRDGTRNATGDEFIELINPHDKPIQLLGYVLTDESQGDKSKLRFTFPAVELKPGQVALVFNGYGASWTGPIGDSRAVAKGVSEAFDKAYLFTMRTTSNRAAFNNAGDSVSLIAPNNRPVQHVRWGTSAHSGVASAQGALDEVLPETSKTSAQRSGVRPGDAWRIHNELVPGIIFSPGKYEMDLAQPAPEKPTDPVEPEKMVGPKPVVLPVKK